MAQPKPTPTESEIQSEGVEVIRDGKSVAVTPSQLRNISQDVALALATKFGADRLATLFDELSVATCITNGGREIPDNRTRLAAAIYVANQILGTPIQRQEINQTITQRSDDDMFRVLATPATMAAIERFMAKAKAAGNPESSTAD